jgi:hypothetical protein
MEQTLLASPARPLHTARGVRVSQGGRGRPACSATIPVTKSAVTTSAVTRSPGAARQSPAAPLATVQFAAALAAAPMAPTPNAEQERRPNARGTGPWREAFSLVFFAVLVASTFVI